MAEGTQKKKKTDSEWDYWEEKGFEYEPITWEMKTKVEFPISGVPIDLLIQALTEIRQAHPGINFVEDIAWADESSRRGNTILRFEFSGTDRTLRATEDADPIMKKVMAPEKFLRPVAESA